MANTNVRLVASLDISATTWNLITQCLNNVVVDEEVCQIRLDENSTVPLSRWFSQNLYLEEGNSNVIIFGFNARFVAIELSDKATITVQSADGTTATIKGSSLVIRGEHYLGVTIDNTESIPSIEGKVLSFGDEFIPNTSSSSSS